MYIIMETHQPRKN